MIGGVRRPAGPIRYNHKQTHNMRRELPLHLMVLPSLLLIILFAYVPMYGVVIAFQKFVPAKGLFGAQRWIGLNNFRYIFEMPNFASVIWNTFYIASLKIVLSFLFTLIVALMLNEVRAVAFKRTVQTVVYFPYFLSWIIFAGILLDILSPSSGVVNRILGLFGVDSIFFLGDKKWFPYTMVFTDIWKNFGFGTVIYLSAMTGIDPTQYEAAMIDGANRWRQTWHVTIPGIRMVLVLLMVLNLGNVLNAGFDQIYNLLSPQVMETGDIIDTLVYRMGLLQSQYGPATAVGLFKSVISFTLISASYYLSYRFFDYRLF